jgi:glycosyltransferase involved in cell wall biosynthesis
LTVTSPKRLAWFSPLPPTRSGVAAYTAELLPHLRRDHHVDVFDERSVHDFAWRARRQPYDLVVYQLGNAPCHDFVWGHLAAYPGLVVLHDARLHHARARQLLAAERAADYRREFTFDHPDAPRDAAEYAVAAMGGPVQYLWPMRRVVVHAARRVAVHSALVADELRRETPDAAVDVIRMGVPSIADNAADRARIRAWLRISDRAIVFTAFGKMTAEKRIGPIARAVEALIAEGLDAHLLLVGDDRDAMAPPIAGRVHGVGFVDDADVPAYLLASDVCLCLRWPTALETSASWLRSLAARRATIVTDLAHTADVPTSVARRVDLLDEDRSLVAAMRELAVNAAARSALASAGHAWWAAHHTLDQMAEDYRGAIARAVATPPPHRALPPHFGDDHSGLARETLARFGLSVDLL